MSSNTFYITVLRQPAPRWQLWRVRNTGAGGVNDYACTRSFALAALLDLRPDLLGEAGPDRKSEAWFAANVARFVEQVFFVAECNRREDETWAPFAERAGFPSSRAHEDHLAADHHYVILSVEVRDPALLEGVPEVFGTVAFDWWWHDPSREPTPHFESHAEYEEKIEDWIAEGLQYHQRSSSRSE